MIKKIFYILCFLLFASICSATNYYVDLDASSDGAGTSYSDPWQWSQFSGATLNASNDYYFKCGSDVTLASSYTQSVNGNSAVDPITLGAYHPANGSLETGTFGQLCSDGNAKPKFVETGYNNNFFIVTGQYTELHSLQTDGGTSFVNTQADYVYIRYSYIRNVYVAVYVGNIADSDYVEIQYNDIDLETPSNSSWNGDAIRIGASGTSVTGTQIDHNWIAGWDHAGIQHSYADGNTVEYNYFYNAPYTSESINFNYEADSNIIRFNYFKDSGVIQLYGGNSNEIYGNVLTCNWGVSKSGFGAISILATTAGLADSNNNNKIYNNTIYGVDADAINYGIKLNATGTGVTENNNNKIYNNVLHTVEGYCFHYADDNNAISGTEFYNNSCYNYGTNEYAYVRDGSTNIYTTASAFNARADASGNRDDDPGLEAVGSYQFWPASESSNVVGNGYDLGASYDDLLDPDTTDFTTSAPSVTLEQQPASWIIGAYNSAGTTQLIKGVILNGIIFN